MGSLGNVVGTSQGRPGDQYLPAGTVLAKTNLSAIEFLIFKALRGSDSNRNEFVSVNNVLKENNEMNEETKSFRKDIEYTI